MKKLEFDEIKVNQCLRKLGAKGLFLRVVGINDEVMAVKIIDQRLSPTPGVTDKIYHITRDEFYKYGYQPL